MNYAVIALGIVLGSVLVRFVAPLAIEHGLAKAAVVATFCLLVIGGTVNPTGSSLACLEPTFVCNGKLFPAMTGGVFYEHGHRLFAMSVGLLQIALTATLWKRRGKLRFLGFLLLGLVIAQGALGAITVAYKLPWFISTSHFALGMSYFATLIYTAFRTRPAPSVIALQQHERQRTELGPARKWIFAAVVAVFCQLVLGALVRHSGAALVCIGMPTCMLDGSFWPHTPIQQLHMLHRVFGCLVAIVTITAAIQVYRSARSWSTLRVLAVIAPVLVLAQIALGVFTVLTLRAVPLAVAHFGGAASLWALWMSAWLMTGKRVVDASTAATEPVLRKMVTT